MLLEGGGLNHPVPSRLPIITLKNPKKSFAIQKVFNELGKVK